VLDLQSPHSVSGHDFLLDKFDLNNSVCLNSILGPIHIALAPATLHEIRDHYYDGHPLLPNHPPETVKGIGQRTLGSNKGMSLLIAIDKVGIDVVQILLLSRCRMQMHSAVIICVLKKNYSSVSHN